MSSGAIDVDVDTSAGREWLWYWVSAIAIKATRQATIVFDGGREVGEGKATLIKSKGRRPVVGLGKRIVEENGVCELVSSNCNAI